MDRLSVALVCPIVLSVWLGLGCSGSRFRDPYGGQGTASISRDTLIRHAPDQLPPDIDHDVRVLMDIRSVQDADADKYRRVTHGYSNNHQHTHGDPN